MIGKQSKYKPVAFGVNVASSTYGMAIPYIFGRTKMGPLLIWAQNAHKSQGPYFTGQFIEQADWLIGHNPIWGVIDVWGNGQTTELMVSGVYTRTITDEVDSIDMGSLGINTFYGILGVTIETNWAATFADYGGPLDYTATGTYETPIWNGFNGGPDPAFPSNYRTQGAPPPGSTWFGTSTPATAAYGWWYGTQLAATPIVYFPQGFLQPGMLVHIYWTAIPPRQNNVAPLQAVGLIFETNLGENAGGEYTGPQNWKEQQITYPHYAGAGGQDFFIGSSATQTAGTTAKQNQYNVVVSSIQFEVLGTHPIYSTGDADFADMVETIFKSGFLQPGVSGALQSWQPNTIYHLNNVIQDSNDDYHVCTVPGISGPTEPAWDETPGDTNLDGAPPFQITWTTQDPAAGLPGQDRSLAQAGLACFDWPAVPQRSYVNGPLPDPTERPTQTCSLVARPPGVGGFLAALLKAPGGTGDVEISDGDPEHLGATQNAWTARSTQTPSGFAGIQKIWTAPVTQRVPIQNPIRFSAQTAPFNSLSTGTNVIGSGASQVINAFSAAVGPVTIIVPCTSTNGDDVTYTNVISVVDNYGNTFSQIFASGNFLAFYSLHTAGSWATTFSVWSVTIPGGIGSDYQITVNYDGAGSSTAPLAIVVSGTAGVDQAAGILAVGTGGSPPTTFTGSSITTTASEIVLAFTSVVDPTSPSGPPTPPGFTNVVDQGEGFEGNWPGVNVSAYGTSGFGTLDLAPAGTYTPVYTSSAEFLNGGIFILSLVTGGGVVPGNAEQIAIEVAGVDTFGGSVNTSGNSGNPTASITTGNTPGLPSKLVAFISSNAAISYGIPDATLWEPCVVPPNGDGATTFLTPRVVQSGQTTATGTTSVSITLPNVTPGNAILVVYGSALEPSPPYGFPGPPITGATISDNNGDTWEEPGGGGGSYEVVDSFYAVEVTGGNTTITVSYTPGVPPSRNWWMAAVEIYGALSPLAIYPGIGNGTTSAMASATAATSNYLVIKWAWDPFGGVTAVDADLTVLQTGSDMILASSLVFTPGTQSTTWTGNSNAIWAGIWCIPPGISVPANPDLLVMQRTVYYPGTYELTGITASSAWTVSLMEFRSTQPASYPDPFGNILDLDTMNVVRAQCRANGLIGSMVCDSQKKASEWLTQLYACMDAEPVWSGFKLKSIARSEVSTFGNGAIFTAPTASGPVATINVADYVVKNPDDSPVTVKRAARVDLTNIQQVQYIERNSFYSQTVVSNPDAATLAVQGARKAAPVVLDCVVSGQVAQLILGVMIRRANYIPDSYSFTLTARFKFLEAMDLILINEPDLGIINLALRLTSVSENDDYTLDCEAEPFVYGLNAPMVGGELLPAAVLQIPTGNNPPPQADPGSVNVPVFVQPPTAMTAGIAQLWIAVSGSNPLYGGAVPYLSTDGGTTWNPIINPATAQNSIAGNATTGYTTADFPAHADPDAADTLAVNLAESLGALTTLSTTDRDLFTLPCLLDIGANGQQVPFTAPTFAPGAPTTFTVPHGLSSAPLFVLLQMTSGGAVWLQSPGFDINNLYLEASASGVTGIAICFFVAPSATLALTPGASGNFQVAHGLSGSPALALVVMNSGSAIWFQSPTTWDATNIYLDAADASATGTAYVWSTAPTLTGPSFELITYAEADLTSAYNYQLPGPSTAIRRAVYNAPTTGAGPDHPTGTRFAVLGNSSQPQTGVLRLLMQPSWIGAPLQFKFAAFNSLGGGLQNITNAVAYSYTPTDLTTGTPPTAVALTPSAGGNFTVAHGLASTPTTVIIAMQSGGAIWLQNPVADGTNLYLTASAGGITGWAECWI